MAPVSAQHIPDVFLSYASADREQELLDERAVFGEEAVARALSEGQAMTLEQAIGYAASDDGDS